MLLAFDTATPLVSVAVCRDQQVLAEATSAVPMKHGEHLAPLISRALADAGADRTDLTAVAVGAGPGPFTGLRVGLVTARTLGFVLDIPVYGACSLDVIAVEAVDGDPAGAPQGAFAVATDARRKEVYWAAYDEDAQRIAGPEVARPGDLVERLDGMPVLGPGPGLYPDLGPVRGPQAPSAGWLGRALADERLVPLDPEPLYLRRPDAVANAARKAVSG